MGNRTEFNLRTVPRLFSVSDAKLMRACFEDMVVDVKPTRRTRRPAKHRGSELLDEDWPGPCEAAADRSAVECVLVYLVPRRASRHLSHKGLASILGIPIPPFNVLADWFFITLSSREPFVPTICDYLWSQTSPLLTCYGWLFTAPLNTRACYQKVCWSRRSWPWSYSSQELWSDPWWHQSIWPYFVSSALYSHRLATTLALLLRRPHWTRYLPSFELLCSINDDVPTIWCTLYLCG